MVPLMPDSSKPQWYIKSIDQRLAIVPGRWMHDHLLRLIDNDDILVFIEDVQRNVLSLISGSLPLEGLSLPVTKESL